MPAATFSGLSYTFYTADGVSTTYPVGFEYLDPAHVKVTVDGDLQEAGFDYQITNGSVVFAVAPGALLEVNVIRETPLEYDFRAVDFRAFGAITEDDMDTNQKQIWYLIQEASERDDTGAINPNAGYLSWDSLREVWDGRRNGADQRIANVASPADEDDVATKGYVDSIAEWGFVGVPQTWTFTIQPATNNYTLSNAPNLNANYLIVAVQGVLQIPNVDFAVTPGSTSSVLTFLNLPVTGQTVSVQNFGRSRLIPQLVLGENAVATENLQNGAVTSEKLDGFSVTETKLADGSVTAAKLATSSVSETKISSGSVSLSKIKSTGFTTAPGGSFDPYLKVDRTNGNLIVETASVLDLSDWLAEIGNIRLNQLATPNANLNLSNFRITNLGAPSAGSDAANKTYVDNAVAGANANNIELLSDVTVGGGTADIELINPASIPSWFTDSDYLYYTFVVTNYVHTGSLVQQIQPYSSGSWATAMIKFVDATFANSDKNSIEFTVVNPRDGATRPTARCKTGGNSASATASPPLGAIQGLRLVQEGGLVTSSPRILVYGHKGLV